MRVSDAVDGVAEGGFLAYIALLPLVQVQPLPVVTRVLLVASALACTLGVLRGRLRPALGPIAGWLSAFVVLSSISVLASYDVVRSGTFASKYLLRQLVVFWIAACLLTERARRRRFAMALVVAGLSLSAFSLGLFVRGVPSVFGGLQGPGLDYNSVCMFLIPIVPFAFAFLSAGEGPSGFAFGLASAIALAAVAIGTFSRIGWAALLVVVAVWTALAAFRRLRVVGAAAVALILFVIAVPDLSAVRTITDNDRFLTKKNLILERSDLKSATWTDVVTFNHRLEYAWKPALALAMSHPVFGAGYGAETFGALVPRNGGPILTHEHSAFLAVAVQSGFPALVAYLGLVGAVLYRTFTVRPRAPFDAALRLAILAAVLAEYVFQAIGEPTNNTRMGILFAALAGLASALPHDE
jgi:O-antigen ligase